MITPNDADYDEARTVFLGGFDDRPAAIARVANAADVATVIATARETGLPLAIRSGGHSSAGHGAVEGGLVTAGGVCLHVDADSHPDLFWAIRGGGGNFGVVTRFKFQLHPVDQVYGGMLMLPATPDVIAGARAVGPLRELATPIVDMVRPMRYPELFPPEDLSYRPKAIGQTMFVRSVGTDTSTTILDFLRRSDAPMRVAQLRALGGAVSRVSSDATAFAHRQSRILVNVAAFYTGPDDKPQRETWTREFAAALHQGDAGAYVAFLGDEGEARVRAAYPATAWNRLAAVKARYDPTNLFRRNQNIPPHAERSPGL